MQSSLLTEDTDTHGKLRSPQMPLSVLSGVGWPPAIKCFEALAKDNHLVYSIEIITTSRSEFVEKYIQ